MGKKVHANGREVSAKASDCRVVAAMPDVCMSPPPPPAGPVPVPYPNTSFAKDLKAGSKDVEIGGQPITLNEGSHYETKPLGNEASTKNFGANLIDHTNAGKTYNAAFSIDVGVEGCKVVRAQDIATSNHAGEQPGGGAMGPNMGGMSAGGGGDGGDAGETCACCKGPLHSEAQRRAPMTTQQFYAPSYPPPAPQPSKKLLEIIEHGKFVMELLKLEPDCGRLIHSDDSDPCARHYPTSAAESNKARREYDAMISPMTPMSYFIEQYGPRLGEEVRARGQRMYAAKKAGAVSIGHVTPLTGGGCPIGERNLHPVSPSCHEYELALSKLQDVLTPYHRKVHRL